jgi:Haem-containing dehydratase
MLESAIPVHLRCERTQPIRTPPNYEPPYPSYSARFPQEMKDVVMAIIGCQYPDSSATSVIEARKALKEIMALTASGPKHAQPRFQDLASVIDQAGAYNVCVIAYWPNVNSWIEWKDGSGFDAWWQQVDQKSKGHGWFLEVFTPSIDRIETISSYDVRPEGAAHMVENLSGPVQEHCYWGSSRDRMPKAQTDSLAGEEWVPGKEGNSVSTVGRVKVSGKSNLVVIRSGQDWSETPPNERKLYEETMHPVLVTGMDFLRDNGTEVGCYSCRLMDTLDASSMKKGTDRTFGLAYFDDLASLEKWSKEHKTHLDIYGGFHKYAKSLNNDISLRLFHEILVLKPEQQLFEYVGCHAQTGMLKSL